VTIGVVSMLSPTLARLIVLLVTVK